MKSTRTWSRLPAWSGRVSALMLAVLLAGVSWAHDPGISLTQVEVAAGRLVISTGFAPSDARHLIDRPGEDTGDLLFEVVRERYLEAADSVWEVSNDGTRLVATERRAELLAGDNLSVTLTYPLPGRAGQLSLQSARLGSLPPGHRQFLIVADARGSTIAKKLPSVKDPALRFPWTTEAVQGGLLPPTSAPPPQLPTPLGFLTLGVEHIWMGYDHLMFLFGLLIVCRTFASILAIVSCFTLAHSLTLAAATLQWVHLPAQWVEPLIAASIIFVGVENLLRRGEPPPGRWLLTFAFGLIHGFGFASVLRDLGVGANGTGIGGPLVLFNLGVEGGQLAVAAVFLPLLWALRRKTWFVPRAVPALSALVALAGLYWLVERIWLA